MMNLNSMNVKIKINQSESDRPNKANHLSGLETPAASVAGSLQKKVN